MNLINNQTEIINTIKLLIYKESPELLEKIDFDDDTIFIEPLLFAYFNAKKNNLYPHEMLIEIMQGYFIQKENEQLSKYYNKNSNTYIPNLGYYKNGKQERFEEILKIGHFEVLKEIHPVQERYFRETYKGHITNPNPEHKSVWKENYKELYNAIAIVEQHLSGFYEELKFANRKIYMHNNPKILNFTTFETLGMLYFYVIEGDNLIYFIEELIHQGSHNFLYYVFHNRKEYFKIDVDTIIMRELTKKEWDFRNVYGAFHGLYTVTKRVECFDILLTKNIFYGTQKHELLGRFADQFIRFRTGLELLDFNEVYTEKGFKYYNELDKKCQSILDKYKKIESFFDLTNRDLDFRYNDFCKLNPIEDFNKKEAEGFFKF